MVWLVLTYCMWYDLDIFGGYTQHISVLYVFFWTCIVFSLVDFWVASFDGPVPFLAAWLLFPK